MKGAGYIIGGALMAVALGVLLGGAQLDNDLKNLGALALVGALFGWAGWAAGRGDD